MTQHPRTPQHGAAPHGPQHPGAPAPGAWPPGHRPGPGMPPGPHSPQGGGQPEMPPRMRTYRKALVAIIVLYALSSIISAVVMPMRAPGIYTQSMAQSIGSAIFGALVAGTLFAFSWLGIARHWEWTRVVGIILALLGIVGTLLGIPIQALMGLLGPEVVLSLLLVAAQIWWLTAALSGQAAWWFSLRPAPGHQQPLR